jgi:iron(II)-dependent oxidoreductase
MRNRISLARAALLAAAAFLLAPAAGAEEAAPPSLPEGMKAGAAGLYTWARDGADMVWVPGGPFPRGADGDEADEGPAGSVTVSSFFVDRGETTNGMYRKFLEALRAAPPELRRNYRHPDEPEGLDHRPAFWPPEPKAGEEGAKTEPADEPLVRDDLPVVGVSWFSAWAYARWAGKDLPSEAEWEKAASFDPAARAKRVWPWGNTPPDFTRCNFQGTVGRPVRPASYPGGAAPCGAHDLAGNVWEWCLDGYHKDFYGTEAGKAPDPVNRFPSAYRVVRGGSYKSLADEVRTVFRDRADPARSYRDVGFRCVLRPAAGDSK